MRRSIRVTLLLGLALVGLAGCGSSTALASTNVRSNACEAGDNCGVFMVITNGASNEDVLVGASSEVADRGELHTVAMDDEGGMEMIPVEDIPIPADGSVELKPGGLHIMLFTLNRALKAGDTFPLTLSYREAGDVMVQVTVQSEN
jgi:periplasmic copper chaperone A